MFSNVAELEWLKQYEKEQDMNTEKSMGHFIDWKFGVPVNVFGQNALKQVCAFKEARLVHETDDFFTIAYNNSGFNHFDKKKFHYELIPYRTSDRCEPRYPVCVTPKHSAYCNQMRTMDELNTTSVPMLPISTATLIIDGKEIQLSAETVARLKKDLGV